MALSLHMPPSSGVLADMLKDMDYACLHLCQICFFRVSSSCIFVPMACGFRVLCFKTTFAGCRVLGPRVLRPFCMIFAAPYARCVMVCGVFRLFGFGNTYLGKWGYSCDNI